MAMVTQVKFELIRIESVSSTGLRVQCPVFGLVASLWLISPVSPPNVDRVIVMQSAPSCASSLQGLSSDGQHGTGTTVCSSLTTTASVGPLCCCPSMGSIPAFFLSCFTHFSHTGLIAIFSC